MVGDGVESGTPLLKTRGVEVVGGGTRVPGTGFYAYDQDQMGLGDCGLS